MIDTAPKYSPHADDVIDARDAHNPPQPAVPEPSHRPLDLQALAEHAMAMGATTVFVVELDEQELHGPLEEMLHLTEIEPTIVVAVFPVRTGDGPGVRALNAGIPGSIRLW
jgi:hypothetical protein